MTETSQKDETREIPFTQFMRPDGRPVVVRIKRPAEIADRADRIISRGFRFECEALSDGMISLTIADDDDDHAIELCPNAPGVVGEAVDRLIIGFKPSKQEG